MLSVIIVSYNTCDLLRRCLASLQAYAPAGLQQIIVVDNASRDGSVAMTREEFPHVILLANEANLGYAAAINQGLRQAAGDYILLLNSDIEIQPGALETLLAFMEATPGAGLCGPQLILPDGRPQPTWRRGFTLTAFASQQLGFDYLFRRGEAAGNIPPSVVSPHEKQPNKKQTRASGLATESSPAPQAYEVEHLDGAALLVRRQALEAVGPMDEGYWMYCEDSDWAWRFRRAGWRLYYVPSARVLHHHGASSRQCRAEMIAAYNRAAARYFRKHYGPLAGALARLLGLLGTSLRLLVACLGTVTTLGLVRSFRQRLRLFAQAWRLQITWRLALAECSQPQKPER